MRLSQSILSSVGDCGLKAQYTIDKPVWFKQTGSAARAVGTGYHAGLESYYLERRDNPGLLPDQEAMIDRAWHIFEVSTHTDLYDNTPIDVFKWSDKTPDLETGKAQIAAMLTEYVNGKHYWPLDWEVVDVEGVHTVALPELAPHTAKLTCDLVLRAADGGIVGVDNKTAGKSWQQGKESPRKNTQSPFYLRLMREVYPDAPYYRFVFDIMTLPGARTGPKFERRISDPTPLHEEAVMARARGLLDLYDIAVVKLGKDLPANPASTLCSPAYCDFWQGCRYGAALD